MAWIIFVAAAWIVTLLLVPLKYWKKSWPVGIFALAIIFILDDTLVKLGAFRFLNSRVYLSGLPFCYWLAYFPGGVMFDYFRPKEHIQRLLYIFVWAAGYLAVELIYIYIGYFRHLNWNEYRAMMLNTGAFCITMWFAEWVENPINICKK
jgi:hypothetical protein